MNKFLSFIVMGLGLAVMPNAQALVYKCVAQEGAITYQDITCATLHPDNRTLVITVNQRLNNRSNTHTRVITLIKKEERSRITAAGRRHQAIRKRQYAQAKAQRQAVWRANHCEYARSQKADIYAALRHGYRAKQERHLKERLKKIEDRERRYCQTTWNH